MGLNVGSEASDDKMDPPIHAAYVRVTEAMALVLTELDGASAVISLVRRCRKPGNMVEPPDKIMLDSSLLRLSWRSNSESFELRVHVCSVHLGYLRWTLI